jgi:hypothetical protein
MSKKCAFVRLNGIKCKSSCYAGLDFCRHHLPSKRQVTAEPDVIETTKTPETPTNTPTNVPKVAADLATIIELAGKDHQVTRANFKTYAKVCRQVVDLSVFIKNYIELQDEINEKEEQILNIKRDQAVYSRQIGDLTKDCLDLMALLQKIAAGGVIHYEFR